MHPTDEVIVTTVPDQSAAVHPLSYAQDLRAIGQSFEDRALLWLEVERVGELYLARGKIEAAPRVSWFSLLRDAFKPQDTFLTARPGLDVSFSPKDIEALDGKGRARRSEPDRVPDAHSLSQMLRGAGAYLDAHRGISLLSVSVRDRWVTLRYKTAEGRLEESTQDLEFFYNYWVKLYLRRKNRTQAGRSQASRSA